MGRPTIWSISDLRECARGRGGECLSEVYKASDTKYRWRCSLGHEWDARWTSVHSKGQWCRRSPCRLYPRKHATPEERLAARQAAQRKYYEANQEAVKARSADLYCSDPDLANHRIWAAKLKREYGLTENEYWNMFRSQEGRCAICPHAPAPGEEKLAVDHDHVTGAVRGLLCRPCNSGIGMLGDSYERVNKAAEYLAESRAVSNG